MPSLHLPIALQTEVLTPHVASPDSVPDDRCEDFYKALLHILVQGAVVDLILDESELDGRLALAFMTPATTETQERRWRLPLCGMTEGGTGDSRMSKTSVVRGEELTG